MGDTAPDARLPPPPYNDKHRMLYTQLAAKGNAPHLVKTYLEQGVSPFPTHPEDMLGLSNVAISPEKVEELQALLEAGLDPNIRLSYLLDTYTFPIREKVQIDIQITELNTKLAALSCHPFALTSLGAKSLLCLAAFCWNSKAVHVLLDHGADLRSISPKERLNTIQILLRQSASTFFTFGNAICSKLPRDFLHQNRQEILFATTQRLRASMNMDVTKRIDHRQQDISLPLTVQQEWVKSMFSGTRDPRAFINHLEPKTPLKLHNCITFFPHRRYNVSSSMQISYCTPSTIAPYEQDPEQFAHLSLSITTTSWRPQYHFHYDTATRRRVHEMVMMHELETDCLLHALPRELLFEIFEHVAGMTACLADETGGGVEFW